MATSATTAARRMRAVCALCPLLTPYPFKFLSLYQFIKKLMIDDD